MITSYRTELAGILSALYLLHALSEFTGTPITTKQHLYCDNSAAVARANKSIDPGVTTCLTADYDLAKEIEVVKSKGINLHMEWVKAHQDNSTPVELLPLEAQLNVIADADVTAFRINTPPSLTPTATPIQFTSTRASIAINTTVSTSNLQQWIRDNYLCSDISRYIQRKTGLTTAQMEEIEWDCLGNALECQKLHTQVRLIKFMHNWLNTGTQKQRFYKDAVSD
jgi:hypothetical protein